MKALVYLGNETLDLRDMPEPSPEAPGDAIVEVAASGICGSDMHAFHGHDPRRVPPLILGHEAAGRALNGRYEGRRVTINPLVTCGECRDCLSGRSNLCGQREIISMRMPGAFAEFVRIPERNLIPLPDHLTTTHAALTEPTAVALHAVRLGSTAWPRPLAEARALVIGGGAIGLLTALILKYHGCRDVTVSEPNPVRHATLIAAEAGDLRDPTGTTHPHAEADHFDLVFDAVGATVTRRDAIAAVSPGGVIVHIGLQDAGGDVDFRKITLQEVTVIGVYTYNAVDVRAAVEALASGGLGSLDWIESRPLADGARAFRDIDGGTVAAAKIILHP